MHPFLQILYTPVFFISLLATAVISVDAQTEQPAFVLTSPTAARTADGIAVLWDKPAGARVDDYNVYLDGRLVATTKTTDHTFEGLAAATEYEISVRALVSPGKILQSNSVRVITKPRPQVFDITKYGAVGDGGTLNTRAIQAAIDACSPGGMVRIPAGVFLSGALFLKSDMTLHLDEGAVLLGSSDTKDYPIQKYRSSMQEITNYASFINTREIQGGRWRDITISGSGKIDANGAALRRNELAEAAATPGRAVNIRDTDRVYLKGVMIRQSPMWCVHLVYCNEVAANGVSIHSKYDETGKRYPGMRNGDGLNPDSCRDVFIFNCHIASQDDCIAVKSGRDAAGREAGVPSENVRISNCRFTSGFGVAMGSEMSGGVRNVLVEDCVFENTFSIASIKAPRPRGNVVENITYRDCTLTNRSREYQITIYFRGAIYVDQFYGERQFDPHKAGPRDEGTGLVRNVLFENITIDTAEGYAIYLTGLSESPLENIRFKNITATGRHGFVANNVRGLVLDNVSVEAHDGKAMRFVNVK
jgi:polygalacturonase